MQGDKGAAPYQAQQPKRKLSVCKKKKERARNRKEGRHTHIQRNADTHTHPYTLTGKCQAGFTRVDKYEASQKGRAAKGNTSRRFNVPRPLLRPCSVPGRVRAPWTPFNASSPCLPAPCRIPPSRFPCAHCLLKLSHSPRARC